MGKAMVVAISAIFVFGALITASGTSSGKTYFFQAIKDFFHYSESGTQRPGVKETPTKFEDTMKKQIRYPETKPATK